MSDDTMIPMPAPTIIQLDDPAPTPAASPICPGERALFPNSGGAHYLRTVFMVYWMNASPSLEVFYLTNRPFSLTPTSIADLEGQILAELKLEYADAAPLGAVYISFSGVELSSAEVTAASWHVITSD